MIDEVWLVNYFSIKHPKLTYNEAQVTSGSPCDQLKPRKLQVTKVVLHNFTNE